MESPLLRQSLASVTLLVFGWPAVVAADEVPATCRADGIVVHGPAAILREHCEWRDGTPWLRLPGGAAFELILDPGDPAIPHAGSGAFHPFDEAVVRAALAAVRYPLAGIDAHVFLLPGPRRDGLESAAGPGFILLSPGVWPLAGERQHAEVAHEIGHLVQYARLPDADLDGWARYRELRALNDPRFSPDAAHADRPHEIFAEDFRALFGGGLANYSGTIENPSLVLPQEVPGLEAFLLGLAGVALPRPGLVAWPNPSRGAVRLTRGGGAPAPVDVFDPAGRRVTTLWPEAIPGGWAWAWDGREAAGSVAGVWFARPREAGAAVLRLVRLR